MSRHHHDHPRPPRLPAIGPAIFIGALALACALLLTLAGCAEMPVGGGASVAAAQDIVA